MGVEGVRGRMKEGLGMALIFQILISLAALGLSRGTRDV